MDTIFREMLKGCSLDTNTTLEGLSNQPIKLDYFHENLNEKLLGYLEDT
jgi:hypothetical protein